ncbi:FtsW/RodA/SpoVE family cell cycle protein [Streptomyces sp. SCUT-3]|uniref:FtsW/RodA/SpoVE family cell cycle protein n=1 Tax=Streptomyces sp. SCUT-3 TaxID=2684469 RepID=UPI0015F9C4DF|nr:FtsW/RodA/SpoVE family cell cycle protein [Streptomyces sp. SCUT-3]QMV21758.1 FtsW/RodA/SpoVE family cell cycle protein [Streptomyces sp. SCUT-3]
MSGTVPPTAVRVPRRRGTELLLTAAAVGICAYGYANVGLAAEGTVPPDTASRAAGLGALALAAHLVVRRCAPCADPLVLPVTVLLNGIGLVVVHRLDLDTPGPPAAPAQLMCSALGIVVFAVVLLVLRDHRLLRRRAGLLGVGALVLTAAPLFFPAVNGARLWIRAGGFSVQPSEFAKVMLAVFFAARLADVHRVAGGRRLPRGGGRRGKGKGKNKEEKGEGGERCRVVVSRRVLAPVVAVWLAGVGLLVAERDLGASLLLSGLFVVFLYVSLGRPGWVAAGLLPVVAGAVVVAALEPHVHGRLQEWLHPLAGYEAGEGTGQLAQSLFAFASGGLLGTGLGEGHSVMIGFAVKSDFVLATVGEELGLVGLTAVLLLYALLVTRGYRCGLALPDRFGRLLAVGLATLVGLQVFVIAGGVTGLVPLTGMAMPFLAQGGSSVVTNWIVVALFVRLSDAARAPVAMPAARPAAPRDEAREEARDEAREEAREEAADAVPAAGPEAAPAPAGAVADGVAGGAVR